MEDIQLISSAGASFRAKAASTIIPGIRIYHATQSHGNGCLWSKKEKIANTLATIANN